MYDSTRSLQFEFHGDDCARHKVVRPLPERSPSKLRSFTSWGRVVLTDCFIAGFYHRPVQCYETPGRTQVQTIIVLGTGRLDQHIIRLGKLLFGV